MATSSSKLRAMINSIEPGGDSGLAVPQTGIGHLNVSTATTIEIAERTNIIIDTLRAAGIIEDFPFGFGLRFGESFGGNT